MSKRRVVVTGLGIVSPLGSSIDSTWAAVLRGESGIFAFGNGEQAGQRIAQRAGRGFAEEHRIAFLAPLDQSRINQLGNVLRNARLALAEHLRNLADAQFHLRHQPHHAQARRIGKSTEGGFDLHGYISI